MSTKAKANRQDPIIGMHLDLKYQMPDKTYLCEWVRRLPEGGVNMLLIEYEDKFPFQKYPFIRHPDAFTPDELRHLLAVARGAGLRVVPLVQTISHLEFALDHDRLAHLRERVDIPTQICPSNPDALAFVHDLIDEVLAFHKEDEWFHAGADEAWFLGRCPKCAERIPGGDTVLLWADHTAGICRYLLSKGKRPLVWSDVLESKPDLAKAFPDETILSSWHYGITRFEPGGKLDRVISAFREGGKDVLCVPCANWGVLFPRHETYENMAALSDCARKKDCLGVIHSAWSVFHLTLPVFWPQVKAAGSIFETSCPVTPDWEQAMLDEEFGIHIEGLPGALAALGRLWEVSLVGHKRPVTPMVHGYMDMVLYYQEGQDERMRRGAYPLNWADVDFNALYLKKVGLIKSLPGGNVFWSDLDRYLSDYGQAVPLLRMLAEKATRHQPEARFLGLMAQFKFAALQALACQVRGTSDREAILAELMALRPILGDAMTRFYMPETVTRLMGAWYQPVEAALKQG